MENDREHVSRLSRMLPARHDTSTYPYPSPFRHPSPHPGEALDALRRAQCPGTHDVVRQADPRARRGRPAGT
jgi:hypothetical protein